MRVSLAAALFIEPDLLMLDEVSTNIYYTLKFAFTALTMNLANKSS